MALAESRRREKGRERTVAWRRKGSDRKGKGWTDGELHERKGERGGSRNKSSGIEDDYRENGRAMEGERKREREGGQDGHRQTDRQTVRH